MVSQPSATLKDFGRSDCLKLKGLQLRIWSAGPHSFLVNIQNVVRGAHCIEMLHSIISVHMHAGLPQLLTVPANFKRNAVVHGLPTTILKDFGRSQCFLQLRIWSAVPHSFLVNIQNVSKGRPLH